MKTESNTKSQNERKTPYFGTRFYLKWKIGCKKW